MSLKTEAIKRFLTAARSLANQGLSREAIMNFAKNEFGEITELFQKQIDNIFKPGQGIKSIKMKDPDFDDTVVKMQFDEEGIPFNPKDPLKDYSKKPRDEKYTGGMVDVEPNLSDIGHGSDALMARTRLMSPGGQATTSTGLNYLLAEDNDNIRIPFSKGKIAKELLDKGRRGFMKTVGSIGAGIAGLKSGLLGFGDQVAPVAEDVIEKVVQNAESVPPYFLNLVKKIKNLGERSKGIKERSESFRYKDYDMDIDYDTGAIEIKKTKEAMIPGGDEVGISEEVYMTYKPGIADETTKGKKVVDEYDEFTARPDMEGKMKDVEAGVTDEVIEEGTMFEDNITDFKAAKTKADGGRIGYSKGKAVFENAAKFLEKIFGKESMAEMPSRDPEMFQGLLEVVDMFRKRDKEGLIKYMRKFLPHKNDAEIEEFIIGSDGTEGIRGELIRLGSGRDYKAKIDMINEASKNRKLADLEITEEMKRKPNASGGIARLLGE